MLEFKDYGLLALAFVVAGVMMFFFRDTQLRGNYPMFEDFFTVFISFESLGFGMLVAAVLRKMSGTKK